MLEAALHEAVLRNLLAILHVAPDERKDATEEGQLDSPGGLPRGIETWVWLKPKSKAI